MTERPPLSPRQALILHRVVADYILTGHPVGSRTLVDSGTVDASPSTVRYELAELEARGLLGHPHTSAGRVPTDAGYRLYADHLLTAPAVPAGRAEPAVDLSFARSEVDTALRSVAEMLSQMTSLLAMVTAPPLDTTEVRHVELLLLQPQVVAVVVITSTGGVTKRLFRFDHAIDPRLAASVGEFLNERLRGVRLGSRALTSGLAEPGLTHGEADLVAAIAPVFTELERGRGEQMLYVGGVTRLAAELAPAEVARINDLVEVLEQRMALLELLRGLLDGPRVALRIGAENPLPAMHSVSIVAGGYGLATRTLGTVALLGPTRMDYAAAIRAVRRATAALSDFVGDVYEG